MNERAKAILDELGYTNIDYKTLSDLIINWLKANDPKNYGEMIRSVGPQRADANPEEIVVNFLERVAEGKIKPDKLNNKVFMGTVAESLSKVTNLNLDFKSQTDGINLLFGLVFPASGYTRLLIDESLGINASYLTPRFIIIELYSILSCIYAEYCIASFLSLIHI